jgi:hypothetical protein
MLHMIVALVIVTPIHMHVAAAALHLPLTCNVLNAICSCSCFRCACMHAQQVSFSRQILRTKTILRALHSVRQLKLKGGDVSTHFNSNGQFCHLLHSILCNPVYVMQLSCAVTAVHCVHRVLSSSSPHCETCQSHCLRMHTLHCCGCSSTALLWQQYQC